MMKRREELTKWLTKIETDGVPKKKAFRIMWEGIIKVLRHKIQNNEPWDAISNFVKEKMYIFENKRTAGADAGYKILRQVYGKIWSINKAYGKINRQE